MTKQEKSSILLIDDDLESLLLLQKYLQSDEFIVKVCSRFEEFTKLLSENDFDLILSDLNMPTVSGLDIVNYVKSSIEHQWTPVIIVTGFGIDSRLTACIEAGAETYFVKPFDFEILRASIRASIKRKNYEESLFRKIQSFRELANDRGEFFTRASHELKTPINAIMGYVSLLNKQLEKDLSDQQNSYLERISLNAKTLLKAINGLLDFEELEARQSNVSLEPVHIEKLVSGIIDQYQSLLIQKNIEVKTNYDFVPGPVFMDREKFSLIVTNLLSNAIKNTEQGEISILVKAQLSEGENFLLYEISDSGKGIPEEVRDRLYQMFYGRDLAQVTKDFGIGLNNVKQALDLLGGSIYFDSTIDKGTKFSLGFPLD
ncbi:MAG: hybrid sensor histidine kinase/response regulator [Candidatus Cloacimonetes bacterium]|nr:hybrid sensor histidine kinase/response regulator [Candidatus Cloacimonadota bacterium]